MSGPGRRFDPAELRVPGEPDPTTAEQADALAAARDLEALILDAGIHPSDGFEDRVMAAIAVEPAPRLVAAPAASVRFGVIGAFLLTVRRSWAIATSGGRPMAVRAQALAFVLLVLLAAGALTSVTAVTVGALLGPNGATGPERSSIPTAAPVASPASPVPTMSPEPTVRPTETAEPTETPEPTETAEPTKTAKPGETARPNRTPRPTETPEPTETPGGTDDHGGGGGPGSGGDDGSGGGSGGGGKGPG